MLLAPSHHYGFSGLASSSADYFRTPLGDVPVDQEALARAENLPQVNRNDQAFTGEHALEVQLPFLQQTLGTFDLIPFIVGDARPREIADVLEVSTGTVKSLLFRALNKLRKELSVYKGNTSWEASYE